MALDEASLPAWLVQRGLVADAVGLRVEPAGDGNINWVRRVRSPADGASWIVKQARPALERFPQYRASTERLLFEARWFELARGVDRDAVCPRILDLDEQERVLVLEDLGDAERLDHALMRGADVEAALRTLADRFRNREMQQLHGDHVFALPYRPNDFPLPPRVRERALEVQRDAGLRAIADAAYARYLEPRGALVHGDVQAGNVLLAASGPKLLDAEIAHLGDPAFDVGTLAAHVLLGAVARGAAGARLSAVRALWQAYCAGGGGSAGPSFREVARYAGLEMMRRAIGAARVPALASEDAALAAIELAARLVREPPEQP